MRGFLHINSRICDLDGNQVLRCGGSASLSGYLNGVFCGVGFTLNVALRYIRAHDVLRVALPGRKPRLPSGQVRREVQKPRIPTLPGRCTEPGPFAVSATRCRSAGKVPQGLQRAQSVVLPCSWRCKAAWSSGVRFAARPQRQLRTRPSGFPIAPRLLREHQAV